MRSSGGWGRTLRATVELEEARDVLVLDGALGRQQRRGPPVQPRGALRDDAGVVLAPRVAEAPQQALLWEGEARAEAGAERPGAQLLAQRMPLAVASLDDLVGVEVGVG